MGFRWSEVQILSPRPTCLSGDRIPGPVSSLPPGVRRVKLSRCAFLLHSKVRGRPSVVCPFDGAVIRWITANSPSHALDILLFPPHPLAPTNLQRFASSFTCKARAGHLRSARSAARSMRYAFPASLWRRPTPSVAWAFGGAKVHWTFACYRLTHRTLATPPLHPCWTLAIFHKYKQLVRLAHFDSLSNRSLVWAAPC